nr:hypothetical protein [Micromonospora sp. DSM 115978]
MTSSSGAGDAASPREASALSSTPPVELSVPASTPPDVTDRGTVRGVLRLSTDVAADPDTWVAYVVKGPASVVKVSSAAPYGADIDTRELPDGSY